MNKPTDVLGRDLFIGARDENAQLSPKMKYGGPSRWILP